MNIQTKSNAQLENKKVNINVFKHKHVSSVKGAFGFGAVTDVGMTLGANPKAGMDTIEFAKYLNTKIVPLYPDTSDTSGTSI